MVDHAAIDSFLNTVAQSNVAFVFTKNDCEKWTGTSEAERDAVRDTCLKKEDELFLKLQELEEKREFLKNNSEESIQQKLKTVVDLKKKIAAMEARNEQINSTLQKHGLSAQKYKKLQNQYLAEADKHAS